ncbi:MAG TPA: hypothetical protein VGC11_14075 [Acidimicrobiia bacterium]|jgi:hypothetical protein
MRIRRLVTAVAAVLLLVSGCGGGGGGNGFSDDFRRQLIQLCRGDADQSEAYCVCWVDELGARFTQDDMIRYLSDGTAETPEGFLEAGFACVDELEGTSRSTAHGRR